MYTTLTKTMAFKITERTMHIGFQYESDAFKLDGAMATSTGVLSSISASISTTEGVYLGAFHEGADGSLTVNINNQNLITDAVGVYELARVEIIKEIN